MFFFFFKSYHLKTTNEVLYLASDFGVPLKDSNWSIIHLFLWAFFHLSFLFLHMGDRKLSLPVQISKMNIMPFFADQPSKNTFWEVEVAAEGRVKFHSTTAIHTVLKVQPYIFYHHLQSWSISVARSLIVPFV